MIVFITDHLHAAQQQPNNNKTPTPTPQKIPQKAASFNPPPPGCETLTYQIIDEALVPISPFSFVVVRVVTPGTSASTALSHITERKK